MTSRALGYWRHAWWRLRPIRALFDFNGYGLIAMNDADDDDATYNREQTVVRENV